MSKTEYLKFRATLDETKEIDRICKTLKLSRSDYLRAVAFGASAPMSTPVPAPASAPAADLAPVTSRLETVESRITEINAALLQSAESFNTLLANINELLRVPTFREFRARDQAEGTIKKAEETELAFLFRLANRYVIKYDIWPNPNNKNTFGPAPADIEKFPRTRPAN